MHEAKSPDNLYNAVFTNTIICTGSEKSFQVTIQAVVIVRNMISSACSICQSLDV